MEKLEFRPVADYVVAPHRYHFNAPSPDAFPITYREVKDAATYKVGEVVYIVYGDGFTKAIISRVGCDKDRWDDWRECYEVHRETKAGQWSKKFHKVWSGYIQRGYQRAGLAPDVPATWFEKDSV